MTTRYGRGRQLAQYEVDEYKRTIAAGTPLFDKVLTGSGAVFLQLCAWFVYLACGYPKDSNAQGWCITVGGVIGAFGIVFVLFGGMLWYDAAKKVRRARLELKLHKWWEAYRADRAKHDYFAHDDGDYDDLR